SELRANAPEFIPQSQHLSKSEYIKVDPSPQANESGDDIGSKAFELDMYGIPWFYYMSQVQFAYNQGFQNGRSKSQRKSRPKKQQWFVSSLANAQHLEKEQTGRFMLPPTSALPLSAQRAQHKQEDHAESVNSASDIQQDNTPSLRERSTSPFIAQKESIARQFALRNPTNAAHRPGIDITTVRNVPTPLGPRNMQPHYGYPGTMHFRNHHNNYHHFNRSDNGLYSYGGRGMAGVPMHDTIPFPNPVPPQGRPYGSQDQKIFDTGSDNREQLSPLIGMEACGTIDIITAAESGGGLCNSCEPDHPLE
ncbi:hypothetical protein GQ44DRAFT_619413, partial [Phaeosphaeriaceae sp. PMI808]